MPENAPLELATWYECCEDRSSPVANHFLGSRVYRPAFKPFLVDGICQKEDQPAPLGPDEHGRSQPLTLTT